MLTLELGDNQSVEMAIFGDTDGCGERVVLINNGDPIGAAVFTIIANTACVMRIGILPEYRRKKFGDFFTRAILYKLSLGGLDLAINYCDDYYLKFGFIIQSDGTMRVANNELRFPSDCGCQ